MAVSARPRIRPETIVTSYDFEDIGGHPGAVADIVAHQVGDHRRVARIIFRDPGLDLAHQIGADVGRLGEDAPAHSHEQGQQGAAKAEAEQGVGGGLAHQNEDDRPAQQAQAVGQHPGDRSGPVGDAQSVAERTAGRRSDPHVALDGHAHPELADQQAEDGAQHKGASPSEPDQSSDLPLQHAVEAFHRLRGRGHDVDRKEQRHRQHGDQRQNPPKLAPQVGVGADPDGVPHLLHPGGALVFLKNLPAQERRIQQAQQGDRDDGVDRPCLERGQAFDLVHRRMSSFGRFFEGGKDCNEADNQCQAPGTRHKESMRNLPAC